MIELVATICFSLAILHTFSVKRFQHIAHRYPEGSPLENFFHLIGEVEVVFGFWAAIFLAFLAFYSGSSSAISYLESQNFTEPAFVFVIMVVCSTRPILTLAFKLIEVISKSIPVKYSIAFYASTLVIGPILGSFITEPAAMTVTALILLGKFYKKGISQNLMYATIGLLFVNVSIGGTLTPFAAPPVLMVAKKWNWDLTYMLIQFGWKAVLSILLSTALITWKFRDEISKVIIERDEDIQRQIPMWVSLTHLLFLVLIVMTAHHLVAFAGVFLFFLGLTSVTQEYQSELKLRDGLLVAFFLGGLVVLGGPQRWWLEPILTKLDSFALFASGLGLTAVTDNAALTYLGSQVPGLSEASKYALVAGSVAGGGLTVIANAPNPAGYGILNSSFGEDGISPHLLLKGALIPTIIAALCFWFL